MQVRRPADYWLRNAIAGSIRTARQAGAAVANAAVTVTTTITAAKVAGSKGCTPNRTVASSRLRTATTASPMRSRPRPFVQALLVLRYDGGLVSDASPLLVLCGGTP